MLNGWLQGKIAPCHILIKGAFCSFLHTQFLFHKKACDLLYVCRSFFSIPLLSMLRWRSIVFALYVNVYQRVPTVNASTYKVMYWHGRFRGDCAELSVYRGCAAEGRVGRRGGTQQSYSVGGVSWIDNTHHLHNTIFTWKANIYLHAQKCKRTAVVSEWFSTWKAADLSVSRADKSPIEHLFCFSEPRGDMLSVRTFIAAKTLTQLFY